MVYDLPVMEEKVKPHQVTTMHMVCALAFIVTGAIIYVYNYTIPYWGAAILLAGIILTILVMGKNKWVTSPKINPVFRMAELLIAISIFAYSFSQQWKFPAIIFGVLAAAILFALYWEKPSDNKLSIHIDNDGIRLPVTARRRSRPWTEVDQVIYRFGILTISFADNSYAQYDMKEPINDFEAFEQYCTAQVEENRSKRRNDDW
ncbi:MAG: hypothetical protein K0Q79_1110 [Flavipsychrobacter sp.]|jgi:uncharacterized membrane protein YfcA|nr:hypothetical protein [Flavipsychrobacter sp.]